MQSHIGGASYRATELDCTRSSGDFVPVGQVTLFVYHTTDMQARTPRQIIDQAVEENRFGERLLYVMACAFAVVGLLVLVWAAINRLPVIAVAGSISTSLFWPAAKSARQTRKESVAIRLLEAPLSRADTAREAAEMPQQLFDELMQERQSVERTKGKTASEE